MMRSRQPLSRIQSALAVALLGMLSLSSARAQTPAPQAAPQSPELAEAHKLAVQVVELHNKKRYDEALPLARRVLEIREHALGKEHLLVGEAAQNLAAVQTARKNYDEALSLYQRALKILEKAYGPDAIKL